MTLPEQMLAIPLPAFGGPEVLQPQNMPLPQMGEADLLIRVAAAGVNAPDIAQRKGHYPPPPDASPLPGLEVAGEIVAMGAATRGFAIGDKVMALANGGGYAEYAAIPYGQVLNVPKGWSLRQAAALPETWFTITQTLVMRAGLRPGMFVLVHGASGGIGGAAIQISSLLGAKPIGIVSSSEKADYARSLGAIATIIHTSEDIVERVQHLTDGHGADRIVDIVGGEMAAANVAASATGGHIVQVSTIGGGEADVPLRLMMSKQLTLSGSTLRPQNSATKAAIARRIASDLLPSLAAPDFVRPRIACFDLENAPDAHRALEDRANYGKIVLLTAFGRGE